MSSAMSTAVRNALRDLDVAVEACAPGWIRDALVRQRRQLEQLHTAALAVESGTIQASPEVS